MSGPLKTDHGDEVVFYKIQPKLHSHNVAERQLVHEGMGNFKPLYLAFFPGTGSVEVRANAMKKLKEISRDGVKIGFLNLPGYAITNYDVRQN